MYGVRGDLHMGACRPGGGLLAADVLVSEMVEVRGGERSGGGAVDATRLRSDGGGPASVLKYEPILLLDGDATACADIYGWHVCTENCSPGQRI